MNKELLEQEYKSIHSQISAHQNPQTLLNPNPLPVVEKLSFNPVEEAENFYLFQLPPEKRVADPSHFKGDDFSLNKNELNFFKKNGFVVQPRHGHSSIGQHYYKIYNNDLPVFITADCILHAWHYSFDRLCGNIEQRLILSKLASVLREMHQNLRNLPLPSSTDEKLAFPPKTFHQVDVYLTTALRLTSYEPKQLQKYDASQKKVVNIENPDYVPVESIFPTAKITAEGESNEVLCETLTQLANSSTGAKGGLFWRAVDWNDFLPRGRYEKSQELRAYFRAVKWLSLPLQLASHDDSENPKLLPNLQVTLLLLHLLRKSNTLSNKGGMLELCNFIKALAGPSDGMTLEQLDVLLQKWGFGGDLLQKIDSVGKLKNIQTSIVASRLGKEALNSNLENSKHANPSLDPQRYVFTFFSGSLGIDHWAATKVTGEVAPGVFRRTMSMIDTAYTTLNNTDAAEIIARRITSPKIPSRIVIPPPFVDYSDHPHLVPEEKRGALYAKVAFDNAANAFIPKDAPRHPDVVVEVRENDTFATIKHVLWPHCEAVKNNKEPTPLNLSASSKDYKVGDFILCSSNVDGELVKDIWSKELITGGQHKFRFNNVFPQKRPEGAPACVDPADYVPLRDGKPFHTQAAAVRTVINNAPQSIWGESVYAAWLNVLRQLSPQSDEWSLLPEAMRTRAWGRRMLNSQLCSYIELQHDFVLYTKKQVLRGGCDYPDGLVELKPAFWAAFGEMVDNFRQLLSGFFEGEVLLMDAKEWGAKKAPLDFLSLFGSVVGTLEKISRSQLNNKPLSKMQEKFLKEMLETLRYGSGPPLFEGWYPQLYWPYQSGCVDCDDGLVCDVFQHTSDPATGDKGGLLHGGTYGIENIVVAVEREEGKKGKERKVMCYAGAIMGAYEFEAEGRFTDNGWQRLNSDRPLKPEWAEDFLC